MSKQQQVPPTLYTVELKPVAMAEKKPSKLPGTIASGVVIGIAIFMFWGEQINRTFSPYMQHGNVVHEKNR